MKLIQLMLLTCFVAAATNISGQEKYFSKSATIQFEVKGHAAASASSRSAVAVIDTKTGLLNFFVMVKSFEFQKALMQEKFNNIILETDQFPKSEFNGKIDNLSAVNFKKDGSYPAQVTGKLTMHGVTREVTAKAIFAITNGKIAASAAFEVSLADYAISNPGVGDGNINIAISCNLELT